MRIRSIILSLVLPLALWSQQTTNRTGSFDSLKSNRDTIRVIDTVRFYYGVRFDVRPTYLGSNALFASDTASMLENHSKRDTAAFRTASNGYYVPLARTVTAGIFMTGGGALSGNITLNVDTTKTVNANVNGVSSGIKYWTGETYHTDSLFYLGTSASKYGIVKFRDGGGLNTGSLQIDPADGLDANRWWYLPDKSGKFFMVSDTSIIPVNPHVFTATNYFTQRFYGTSAAVDTIDDKSGSGLTITGNVLNKGYHQFTAVTIDTGMSSGRIAIQPTTSGAGSVLELMPKGTTPASEASTITMYTTDRKTTPSAYQYINILADTMRMYITGGHAGGSGITPTDSLDINMKIQALKGITVSGNATVTAGYIDADSSLDDGTTWRTSANYHSGLGASSFGNMQTGTVTAAGDVNISRTSVGGFLLNVSAPIDDFSGISINSGGSASQYSVVQFKDRTTSKWELRKTTTNTFDIYNNSAGSVALEISNSNDVAFNGTGTHTFAGEVQTDSSFVLNERSTDPTLPTSNTQMMMYMKGDKIVWVINAAGTPRYYYFDATATANQQIIYSATAP